MFNIRYHIASLVSVFLALAVGLFLGAAIVDQGAVEESGAALVKGLREEFDALRADNSRLEAELADSDAFGTYLLGEWAYGRLSTTDVLVVTGTGGNPVETDLRAALESAGGRLVTIEVLERGFGAPQLASLVPVTEGTAPTEDELRDRLAAIVLAELTVRNGVHPTLDALVSAGAVRVTGLEPDVAVNAVVDLAVSAEGADPAGTSLLKAATVMGLRGYAVAPPDLDPSIADAVHTEGFSVLTDASGDRGRHAAITLVADPVPVGLYGALADGTWSMPRVVRD